MSEKIYCDSCGLEIENGYNYCPHCGEILNETREETKTEAEKSVRPSPCVSDSEMELMRHYAEAHGVTDYPQAHGYGDGNYISECDYCGCSLDAWYKYCPKCGDELSEEESPVVEKSRHVRPLPCVRDEHGAIGQQTTKQLLQKINEELDELKAAVLNAFYGLDVIPAERPDLKNIAESYGDDMMKSIAEEAADTITAITTMLEALGINAEMRDEAQRQVNERNRERGRL